MFNEENKLIAELSENKLFADKEFLTLEKINF
jgi:hypothetical protein